MHKLIAIGDVQICPKSYELVDSIFKNQLLPLIKKEKPNVVIFPGDLFEFSNYTNNYVSAASIIKPYTDLFYELTNSNIDIIIVDGNHDKTYGDFSNSNDIFKHRLVHHASNSPLVVNIDEVSYLLVPWLLQHQYNRLELIKNLTETCSNETDRGRTPILVGHMRMVGAKDTLYEVKDSVHDFCFTNKEIESTGIKYGILGDIHKFQKVTNEIYYMGSLRQRHFGEAGNPSMVRIMTFDGTIGTSDYGVGDQFIELSGIPQYSILFAKDEPELIQLLSNEYDPINEYRIEINFETTVKSKIKNVHIRNRFSKPANTKLNQSIENISFDTTKLLTMYNNYTKTLSDEELREAILYDSLN